MWRMYKSSAAPFVHATTTTPTTFAPPTMSTMRTTAARAWHGFTTQRAFTPTTATTPKTYAPSTYATFSEFFDLQGFNSLLANDVVHGMWAGFTNLHALLFAGAFRVRQRQLKKLIFKLGHWALC